jgi:hypothetical protein
MRVRFSDSSQWDVIRKHPLVRFRPQRDAGPPETYDVTLRVALMLVEGKLASLFGAPYKSCAVLVGLRLGRGSSVGQTDLVVLTRSGHVALGECKLSPDRRYAVLMRDALRQLERYEKTMRRSRQGWLLERIEDSYARFDFPDCGHLLTLLGVKSKPAQRKWWAKVFRNLQRGHVDRFVAIKRRWRANIEVWRRCDLPLRTAIDRLLSEKA